MILELIIMKIFIILYGVVASMLGIIGIKSSIELGTIIGCLLSVIIIFLSIIVIIGGYNL